MYEANREKTNNYLWSSKDYPLKSHPEMVAVTPFCPFRFTLTTLTKRILLGATLTHAFSPFTEYCNNSGYGHIRKLTINSFNIPNRFQSIGLGKGKPRYWVVCLAINETLQSVWCCHYFLLCAVICCPLF